jgi:hypothetical protein
MAVRTLIVAFLIVPLTRSTIPLVFGVAGAVNLDNAVTFLDYCKSYFPFYISHVLTDNGAEFTDRFTCKKNEP